MSTHDLRDKLDGLNPMGRMEAVYPEPLSRMHRGLGTPLADSNPQSYKRKVKKNMDRKGGRFRTQPVTFMEIKEVDEDTPDLTVTLSHGPNNGGSVGDDDENQKTPISNQGSGMDILSIAEAHREKSKSQQDLKRQFEEFSRNLSFRRTGSDRRNKAAAHAQLSCLTPGTTVEEDDDEGHEESDEVGALASIGNVMPGRNDIDFPNGFNMKARPSI